MNEWTRFVTAACLVAASLFQIACKNTTDDAGAGGGGGATGGGAGGDPVVWDPSAIDPMCVPDELDGTRTAKAIFETEGTKPAVTVSFADGALTRFDGMACQPKSKEVPPEYPGCGLLFQCGPCSCQVDVPGIEGMNTWRVKCTDPDYQWDECAAYKYVDYEIGPWEAPSSTTSSGTTSTGSGCTGACCDCGFPFCDGPCLGCC
jgi:hypothetical protein